MTGRAIIGIQLHNHPEIIPQLMERLLAFLVSSDRAHHGPEQGNLRAEPAKPAIVRGWMPCCLRLNQPKLWSHFRGRGIGQTCARTIWLTEGIASMGKPHEDPIQTTKTQARVRARAAVGKLRRKRFRKKTGRTTFFYLISALMADPLSRKFSFPGLTPPQDGAT